MLPRCEIVPSPDRQTGFDALRTLAFGASRLSGAVAFVTSSGVDLIEQLLQEHPALRVSVVARGAPVTEPAALERLEALGVSVFVVAGARTQGFHPKLWLAHRDEGLLVLSGSGNLTDGGLRHNDEQFELLHIPTSDEPLLAAHEWRMAKLTEHSVPLSAIRSTNYWATWQHQMKERSQLADSVRRLDERLSAAETTDTALEHLREDLLTLYHQTKDEVTLTASDGSTRPYVATYFKRALDQCDRTGGPAALAARIVKSPTEGFERLSDARRPDLLVESLVLNGTKSYHHLFSVATIERARRNMDRYEALFDSDG